MKKVFLALTACIFAVSMSMLLLSERGVAVENNEENYDDEISSAFNVLKTAPRLESRLIGEGGIESLVFQAYSILTESNHAAELFAKLHEESLTNAGKVYAAMWFFKHDTPAYLKARASVRDDETVEVQIACIVTEKSMREIFADMEEFAAAVSWDRE